LILGVFSVLVVMGSSGGPVISCRLSVLSREGAAECFINWPWRKGTA
jgi:hypothetical protein